jgi:L-lysine exporter family protein LysE/ArgO
MSNTLISSSWVAGFTVCLSLIISIGAQNLYVLRQAVQGRHVGACVAWCVISDALLIAAGVAGMSQLIARAPTLAHYLAAGGALFLLAYGLYALWRVAFAADVALQGSAAAQRGLLGVLGTLAVITLLNPHVYLDTVLLVGSIGARQEGALKAVFVAGAACASLLWFALLASAGRRMQRWFARPAAWRVLDALTGLMMLALAWWVWKGVGAAP